MKCVMFVGYHIYTVFPIFLRIKRSSWLEVHVSWLAPYRYMVVRIYWNPREAGTVKKWFSIDKNNP